MKYGTPSPLSRFIMDHVDSIPVEQRLRAIEELSSIRARNLLVFHTRTWYQRYLVGSSFIDVRLLRLLDRYATRQLKEDEKNLSTACEIINYLRNKFPDGSFDYLTPNYVLDWYYKFWVIPQYSPHSKRRIQLGLVYLATEETTDDLRLEDPQKPVLVQLEMHIWNRYFLQDRLNNLAKTGYESPTYL